MHTITIQEKILSSRDLIDLYKEDILSCKKNEVRIDLSEVEFMSRSAAHQLIRVKNQLEYTENTRIYFEHAQKDVADMLQMVAQSMVLREVNKEEVEFEHATL